MLFSHRGCFSVYASLLDAISTTALYPTSPKQSVPGPLHSSLSPPPLLPPQPPSIEPNKVPSPSTFKLTIVGFVAVVMLMPFFITDHGFPAQASSHPLGAPLFLNTFPVHPVCQSSSLSATWEPRKSSLSLNRYVLSVEYTTASPTPPPTPHPTNHPSTHPPMQNALPHHLSQPCSFQPYLLLHDALSDCSLCRPEAHLVCSCRQCCSCYCWWRTVKLAEPWPVVGTNRTL